MKSWIKLNQAEYACIFFWINYFAKLIRLRIKIICQKLLFKAAKINDQNHKLSLIFSFVFLGSHVRPMIWGAKDLYSEWNPIPSVSWSYSVVAITWDSESHDPSSNLGRTFTFLAVHTVVHV